MEVIKDASTVIGLVLSFVSFIGLLWAVFKFVDRQGELDKEMALMKVERKAEDNHIKEELRVLTYGMLAALDGLKQVGANGNVTDAYDALSKHLNKAAHRETEV